MRFFGWFKSTKVVLFACGHEQASKMKDRKRNFKWNFSQKEALKSDCLDCYLAKNPDEDPIMREADVIVALARQAMLTDEVIVHKW